MRQAMDAQKQQQNMQNKVTLSPDAKGAG